MAKTKIVTHSSKFHTDDIFAVATLTLFLGEENIEIVRSRDPEVIKTGDYAVDVGGEYNFDTKRFDHHQIGGAGQRENGIPYASFGLVWKHFGIQVSGSEEVMKRIDQLLVQAVDAGDNGVKTFDAKIENVNPYTIGAFFDTYNPSWKNEDNVRMNEFMSAVLVAKNLLMRIVGKENDFFEADRIVRDLYNRSEDKRLIVMDKYYPSNETLCCFPEPLFTVYPQGDGKWVIKAIKNDEESFDYRKYLPKDWSGKTGVDLEKVTGVDGANSCHNALFIATAKSKEAILKMAEIALNS